MESHSRALRTPLLCACAMRCAMNQSSTAVNTSSRKNHPLDLKKKNRLNAMTKSVIMSLRLRSRAKMGMKTINSPQNRPLENMRGCLGSKPSRSMMLLQMVAKSIDSKFMVSGYLAGCRMMTLSALALVALGLLSLMG